MLNCSGSVSRGLNSQQRSWPKCFALCASSPLQSDVLIVRALPLSEHCEIIRSKPNTNKMIISRASSGTGEVEWSKSPRVDHTQKHLWDYLSTLQPSGSVQCLYVQSRCNTSMVDQEVIATFPKNLGTADFLLAKMTGGADLIPSQPVRMQRVVLACTCDKQALINLYPDATSNIVTITI